LPGRAPDLADQRALPAAGASRRLEPLADGVLLGGRGRLPADSPRLAGDLAPHGGPSPVEVSHELLVAVHFDGEDLPAHREDLTGWPPRTLSRLATDRHASKAVRPKGLQVCFRTMLSDRARWHYRVRDRLRLDRPRVRAPSRGDRALRLARLQ